MAEALVHIGVSGWSYPHWRRRFYPDGLPQRRELEYVAERMDSVEINASFYSLRRPENYRRWAEQTPDGFVFAVKGSRFITHLLALRDARTPLANFFASGVLALGERLGPLLWQLPPSLRFDRERLEGFLRLLPSTAGAAAELAARHDHRLDGRELTSTDTPSWRLRHALEVRHDSYHDPDFPALAREYGVAVVTAHTAGRWPLLDEPTADFAYLRLHGAESLYVGSYGVAALRDWAERALRHHDAGRDVYVYFDNDTDARAPQDAMTLRRLVRTAVVAS
jgi:uncharacterized protein YecE (DUF72 family)